jgi:hydroxymethylpyrimidine/phosphomethylpyrimidine kinase
MEPTAKRPTAPVALSIAGSDSGANAGIQADLLSFAANGAYGTTIITSVTSQNPSGVAGVEAISTDLIRGQIEQVVSYYHPRAIKTGMLGDAKRIEAVAESIDRFANSTPLVVDPVMIASSGSSLLADSAVDTLKSVLLPRADLIAPNLDEAEALLGYRPNSRQEMESAALQLADQYQSNILIKGGHLPGEKLFDILALSDGSLLAHEQDRIDTINTHGSGCTLAAAIAAWIARGESIASATRKAQSYLRRAMDSPLILNGRAFINHFP